MKILKVFTILSIGWLLCSVAYAKEIDKLTCQCQDYGCGTTLKISKIFGTNKYAVVMDTDLDVPGGYESRSVFFGNGTITTKKIHLKLKTEQGEAMTDTIDGDTRRFSLFSIEYACEF